MADEKKPRDWLAVTISILSLCIAAIGAYISLLQKDDLRLVPGYSLGFFRNDKGDLLLEGEQQLTFLNAGSRAAVVIRVGMTLFKRKDDKATKQECAKENESDLPIYVFLDSKPAVVKSGEIQVAQLKPIPLFPWEKAPDQQVRLPHGFLNGKANDFYLACLEAVVTAPDSPSVRWLQPLYFLDKDKVAMQYVPKDLYVKDRPITILSRTQYLLGWPS